MIERHAAGKLLEISVAVLFRNAIVGAQRVDIVIHDVFDALHLGTHLLELLHAVDERLDGRGELGSEPPGMPATYRL